MCVCVCVSQTFEESSLLYSLAPSRCKGVESCCQEAVFHECDVFSQLLQKVCQVNKVTLKKVSACKYN